LACADTCRPKGAWQEKFYFNHLFKIFLLFPAIPPLAPVASGKVSMQQPERSALRSALANPYFPYLCFGVYLLPRLAIILLPIDQYSDNLWYFNRGVALSHGQGYFQNGIPTAYWPPGWPGVLGLSFWLFRPLPLVGQIVNLVFAALTFPLALRLGMTLFADEAVGRLTVVLLALYPNQIAYVPVLGTEVFYTAVLLLSILVLIRGHTSLQFFLSGLLFGIATLTKAQTLFIPAVLFSVWWLAARGSMSLVPAIGRATLVYAAMAIVILPWTARNYVVFSDFVLISTNGGKTLLSGNNPSAWGDYTENDALVKQVPNDVTGQVADDRLATSLALEWIRQNPAAFLILVPKKVWRLWAPDGEGEWAYQAGYKDYDAYSMLFRALGGFNQLYYSSLMILFGLSLVYFAGKRGGLSPSALTGYILALYFTAVSIVFSGQSRFHFPMMPWIAMYAAWTIAQWLKERQPADRAALAIAADRQSVVPD
jgi:hypothetical protein